MGSNESRPISKSTSQIDLGECSICLELMICHRSDLFWTACAHVFHIDCVSKWFKTKKLLCPICNTDLSKFN